MTNPAPVGAVEELPRDKVERFEHELAAIVKRYPPDRQSAAMLPALRLGQELFGYLSPAVQKFVAEIRKRTGHDPEANAALGYDALRILADAMRRAGSLDRARIRDEIAATKNFAGVSGVITMGPDRDPIKPVAMIKIDGGTTHFVTWVQP